MNVKEAVNKNVGVRLEWHGMTEEKLETALLEVLTNPEYQSSVDRLSSLILDQPQHPLDRSVWWLEYLIRHPANTSMKPYTHNLYWFQYFLLDVILLMFLVLAVILIVLVKLVRCCCCRGKDKSKKD